MPTNIENLGPAERIINMLLAYTDHMVHNRPGYVRPDTSAVGVNWAPVTTKEENGEKIVYALTKIGKKTNKARIGVLQQNNQIKENNRVVGEYREAGLFKEVAAWMYSQVAEIYKLDNEFVARWASYAFDQDHKDLKVVLAAFMLVQSRKGEPIRENGKILFYDDDYRDVGEAMMLILRNDKKGLDPKLLLRIRDLLMLPAVAKINHDLGFGNSARNPFLGRWSAAVSKWLSYREDNIKLLEGLVKAGYRTRVMDLARAIGYKPTTEKFFELLRWKQKQAKDGRRTLAIGKEIAAAESWEGLSEEKICEKIDLLKPSWKIIVSRVPKNIGITRAIMAAAIEKGCLSNKDLIIATPTIEDLGLLNVPSIKQTWEMAVKLAEDTRAANIASRVKNKETQDKLVEAADNAVKTAVAEVVKGLRIYFMVDISGSMESSIEKAKEYIAKFLQAFPQEAISVSVFNTAGRELKIAHNSAAGVQHAFVGIRAGGGTDYGSGVRVLSNYKPKADEDALFIFVGDEEAPRFTQAVRNSGLNPVAFGFVKVGGSPYHDAVRGTASELGVPCFIMEPKLFDDVYAIPRVLRNLIASTPVTKAATAPTYARVSLVETILKTDILRKPAWA